MNIDFALRLRVAYELGEFYANNLMPGLIFLGAGPAAEAKGFEKDTPEYRMFLCGALEKLERMRVICDQQNRIVEVQR
jgi:hypothetical protein